MNENNKTFTAVIEDDCNEFLKYDSLEDINACLNCQREECCNCLKIKNGV